MGKSIEIWGKIRENQKKLKIPTVRVGRRNPLKESGERPHRDGDKKPRSGRERSHSR